MTGLLSGFRETLEAAVIIVLLLAALRRLGHGHLAQAAWYGVGAGALFGVSVATGLVSVRLDVAGLAFVRLQLVSLGLALLALTGLGLWMRRRRVPRAADLNEATEAPGAWLAVVVAFCAALPQSLELVVRLAGSGSQAAALNVATAAAGSAAAVALARVLYIGLLRCTPARFIRPAARRKLAPVTQETDDRGFTSRR